MPNGFFKFGGNQMTKALNRSGHLVGYWLRKAAMAGTPALTFGMVLAFQATTVTAQDATSQAPAQEPTQQAPQGATELPAVEVTAELRPSNAPPDGSAGATTSAGTGAPPDMNDAASAFSVTGAEVNQRIFSRPAEALAIVPGLVITQHSGDGKANQYFLRGFNLDHGTDLAIFYDGMPMNMPTHAHGQGYTDLNMLIPELISTVDIKKGPYFADEGDFASAGAVHINLRDSFDGQMVKATLGSFDYLRYLGRRLRKWRHGPGFPPGRAIRGAADNRRQVLIPAGLLSRSIPATAGGLLLVSALQDGAPQRSPAPCGKQ